MLDLIQKFQNELLILGGLVVVMFVAVERFNTWPPQDSGQATLQPPRSFTTFGRYLTFCTLYVLLFEAVYLLLVFFPDASMAVLDRLGFEPSDADSPDNTEFAKDYTPLWALFILAGLLNAPFFKKGEPFIRERFHRRAAIKSKVEGLIRRIQYREGVFNPDEQLGREAIEATRALHVDVSARSDRYSTFSHKWFRAIYLLHMVKIQDDPGFNKFLTNSQEEFRQIEKFFETMREEMNFFLDQRSKNKDFAPRRWGRSLEKGLDDLLQRLYQFAACGVYTAKRTEKERATLLGSLGFDVSVRDEMPFGADVLVKSLLAIFLAIVVPTMIYLFLLRDVANDPSIREGLRSLVPKDQWWAMYWVCTGLLMHGAAMTVALMMRRWYLKNGESDSTVAGTATASRLAGVGLVGYLASFAVLLTMSFVAGSRWQAALLAAAIWSLTPAITAFFISKYVSGAVEGKSPETAKNVVLQSAVMASASLFLCLFVPGAMNPEVIHAWFALYVVSASVLIGACIAYVFPPGYREHVLDLRNARRDSILQTAYEKFNDIENKIGTIYDELDMPNATISEERVFSVLDEWNGIQKKGLEDIVTSKHVKLITPEIEERLKHYVDEMEDYLEPKLASVRSSPLVAQGLAARSKTDDSAA